MSSLCNGLNETELSSNAKGGTVFFFFFIAKEYSLETGDSQDTQVVLTHKHTHTLPNIYIYIVPTDITSQSTTATYVLTRN